MTAIDIIKRSLRLIGAYSIGESPSSEESNDALEALNSMLDSMANEGMLVYAKSLDPITLSANVPSYTVGPSGSTITTRPVEVLASSYIDYQGVSYPVVVDTLADYNLIPVKGLIAGIPNQLWALMSVPDITLTVWPVPSATMTLNLWSQKQFKTFASLTDSVNLPPGYDEMLAFCLAEVIAPEYQLEAPPTVLRKASSARKVIKRTNSEIPRLRMPYGVPMNRGYGGNYRLG